MKVLHVSGAKGWGGNEQQMVDLIPELSKLGVENIVFGVENSLLEEECKKNNINFIVAKNNKLNKFVNYRYLKILVQEIKPDLIHLHTSDSLTVFTISDLLFRLKTKAVFSKKGMGSSSSILSKFKYNYKNIAAIICVSEAVKKSFSSIITKNNIPKLSVVYDGINLNRTNDEKGLNVREFFNIDEDKIIIGNIANHVKAKDLLTLVRATSYLVNDLDFKNIHLLQIGKFSNKWTDEIKNLIAELQLEEYITLADFQPHALDFLTQFDLYVMSSEREGLPLTIFEAFLKKTPVVSTRAGGIPEAVTHDYNGYLCDVKDFKNLAINIQKLLNDKEKQEEFVNRSYDIFFKNFTAERSANNTLSVYKNINK
jgi:glycosyltransferase involved in cell wall biosynthesis